RRRRVPGAAGIHAARAQPDNAAARRISRDDLLEARCHVGALPLPARARGHRRGWWYGAATARETAGADGRVSVFRPGDGDCRPARPGRLGAADAQQLVREIERASEISHRHLAWKREESDADPKRAAAALLAASLRDKSQID